MVTLVLVLLVLLVVLVVLVGLGVVVEAAWFGSKCCLLPPTIILTCEANDGDILPCSSWRFAVLFVMTCHDAIPFKIFKTFQTPNDVWLVVSGGWFAQYFVDVAFW